MSLTKPKNEWELIDWDGNPALGLKCYRKKFGRGHVSVGVGEYTTITYSFGRDSDHSFSDTRRRPKSAITEQQAMELVESTIRRLRKAYETF